ncbi:thiamine pyrophosphate-binding protein [Nocardioides sp. NPDC051685]|uniref:thiamine pyrophosphate-binding protein n=1 Tax=Nocardioides sp. NPDC051685 TaxID=3364334 RepID=UPI00378FF3AD
MNVMTSTPTTVVGALARTMADLGMRHLFTLMGAGNLRLIHHLAEDHDVTVHHFRHENGAVGAADGYARVTGEVGWCTVTQGPGFTNTITALLTAHKGRSPVVMITSDSSSMDPLRFPFAGGVQGLDPEVILAPLGIPVVRATRDRCAADLIEAYQRATEERCTVVFVIPTGMDLDPTAPAPASPFAGRGVSGSNLDEEALTQAERLLRAAQRPLIVAGYGVHLAGAAGEVAELAERLGAHLATTAKSVGIFHGNSADLGIFGGFSPPEAAEIIEASDCILAIGAGLNLFQTRKNSFIEGRTVIQIDRDAASFGRWSEPDLRVLGDARDAVARLNRMLETIPPRPRVVAPSLAAFDDISVPGEIDPRTLSAELDRALPAPRRILLDNGHFGAFPVLYMTHAQAGSVVWMPDFGAVGSALAAAAASAVSDPDLQSVLFIGDCGFYMTMGDLETVVRERIPLVVVCMNDGAAGSELAHMKDWGVPPEQALFGYADVAAAAAGMGATASRIDEVSELEPAIRAWDPQRGPLFLDCHVSREVRSPIYDHV